MQEAETLKRDKRARCIEYALATIHQAASMSTLCGAKNLVSVCG